MNNPFASIFITTFGRVKNLEEAIFSSLIQDYDNYEIIVLNGFKEQKLYINNYKAKIINYDISNITISEAKNILIDNCNGEILFPLDDDDILKSTHLKEHVDNIIINNVDASICNKCLFWERNIGKLTIQAYTQNIAFRKKDNIRYIKHRDTDFDQHFRNYLRDNIKYKELINNPTYVYCWNNNVFHVSGSDKKERFFDDVKYRVDNNLEPIGNIEILPHLRHDAKKLLKV